MKEPLEENWQSSFLVVPGIVLLMCFGAPFLIMFAIFKALTFVFEEKE
jgi:hypothetical protein